MIEFYPNKLSNTAPLGTWVTDRRMTIEEWLKSHAPSYERRESPPVSVVLNDEVIEQRLWHKVKFKPSDLLQIYREPKGTDPFSITFALFKGAKAVLKSIMPKMPGMPSSAGTQQGEVLVLGVDRALLKLENRRIPPPGDLGEVRTLVDALEVRLVFLPGANGVHRRRRVLLPASRRD